jgi:hypothetical protein
MKFSLRTITRLLALFILSTCLSWWWFSGADVGWTKTYVTIPATDEITGIQYEVKQENSCLEWTSSQPESACHSVFSPPVSSSLREN